MIRFVDLDTQIDDTPRFAFFDTVKMRFLATHNGWCVWESEKDFEIDYLSENYGGSELERFLDLIPEKYK